jgi:hypothetical protein
MGYPQDKGRLRTCSAPVCRSLVSKLTIPLDLHVLSLPLAFILSQNQTLLGKWDVELWLIFSRKSIGSLFYFIRLLTFMPNLHLALLLFPYFKNLMLLSFLWRSAASWLMVRDLNPFAASNLPSLAFLPGCKGNIPFPIHQIFFKRFYTRFDFKNLHTPASSTTPFFCRGAKVRPFYLATKSFWGFFWLLL